ncbi:Response regulator receiver domain-containing protein [Aureimonas jatrophae]|uniref:histidine kinase n=2 Tax=Aureimonas jatrophae TaxID=1166073 RepID=A0A1H0DBF5_9HYPH|nr:Response regulator receiver domain-containing protein [Aureimonas jatrophae]
MLRGKSKARWGRGAFGQEAKTMRDGWISFAAADREPASALPRWKLLIVDDDQAVHDGTRFALQRFALNGRRLEFHSAYSGTEGFEALRAHPDTAVVLLDVVMESEDAGLRLARRIRNELGNDLVRIILRTGQPGQAPEHKVVVDYDINDYKAKTELTAERLFTALTAALRSFEQLRRLDDTRRGLELIVQASSDLFSRRSLETLGLGVLLQLNALLALEAAGIVLARESANAAHSVLARLGTFAGERGERIDFDALFQRLATEDRRVLHEDGTTHLFLRTEGGSEFLVLVDNPSEPSPAQVSLLAVFAAKLAIAFDNARLHAEILAANEELEERVHRRTGELATANARLEAQGAQLRRVNAFKNEILGTIAHDLKNPLGVIMGRAEMLAALADRLDEAAAAPFRQQTGPIREAAQRLTRILDRSLNDAMADAVDIVIEARPADVGRIVERTAELARSLAEAKAQTLSLAVEPGLGARCDPDRVAEAVENLVGNAVKYTPAGGRIEVSAARQAGEIAITVADSGPGLRPEDVARLFGRFQRLSAQPTGGESATGLGLSIVRKIAELHGGRIEAAEHGPLGGAAFTLTLPVDRTMGTDTPTRTREQP